MLVRCRLGIEHATGLRARRLSLLTKDTIVTEIAFGAILRALKRLTRTWRMPIPLAPTPAQKPLRNQSHDGASSEAHRKRLCR
jgi:hypothetical protein